MVDEISYKDIKITNTSWETVFDMYSKNYTPEKASKELVRLDESLEDSKTERSIEPYEVDGKIRRRISKFYKKYKTNNDRPIIYDTKIIMYVND